MTRAAGEPGHLRFMSGRRDHAQLLPDRAAAPIKLSATFRPGV